MESDQFHGIWKSLCSNLIRQIGTQTFSILCLTLIHLKIYTFDELEIKKKCSMCTTRYYMEITQVNEEESKMEYKSRGR